MERDEDQTLNVCERGERKRKRKRKKMQGV